MLTLIKSELALNWTGPSKILAFAGPCKPRMAVPRSPYMLYLHLPNDMPGANAPCRVAVVFAYHMDVSISSPPLTPSLPQLRTRGMIDRITQCEYGKASARQLHSNTRCCFWSGHTRKQSNSLAKSSRKQESRYTVPKFALRAVLERMQFTLHATRRTPHGASRLVQATSAWLVW